MSGAAGSGLDSQFFMLWFGSSISEELAVPDDDDGSFAARYFAESPAPYARAVAHARPALEELFAEWAARGHVPLVPYAQPHEVLGGTLIEDLSSPDDGDPYESHFRDHHQGGPCLVVLHRELDERQCFDLQLLVTDRVRESELEPILQQVSQLLKKACAAT